MQQQSTEALQYFQIAAQMIADGKSSVEIKDELVQKGLDETSAWQVINVMEDEVRKEKREQASKSILYGILWGAGGLILTIATGGKYLFYGAIIVGVVKLIGGIASYMSND